MRGHAWPVGCWWSCVTAGRVRRAVYVVACTIRQMPAGLGFCGDIPQVVCVVGYVPRDSYDSTWAGRPSATVQWCQCEEWRWHCVRIRSHGGGMGGWNRLVVRRWGSLCEDGLALRPGYMICRCAVSGRASPVSSASNRTSPCRTPPQTPPSGHISADVKHISAQRR